MGAYIWHMFHHELCTEGDARDFVQRREKILRVKPIEEQTLRLRLMRPVRIPASLRQQFGEEFDKPCISKEVKKNGVIQTLHRAQCPRCPFGVRRKGADGPHEDDPRETTIFRRWSKRRQEWY